MPTHQTLASKIKQFIFSILPAGLVKMEGRGMEGRRESWKGQAQENNLLWVPKLEESLVQALLLLRTLKPNHEQELTEVT